MATRKPQSTYNLPKSNAPAPPIRLRSYDGIYRSSERYPPFSLDALTAQKGYDTAELMLTSAYCRAPFNIKRYSVLSENWEVNSAVRDPKDSRHAEAQAYADFIRWTFNNILSPAGLPVDFRKVLFQFQRGVWDGFHVAEKGLRVQQGGEYDGLLCFRGFYSKHAKQIGFDRDPDTGEIYYLTSYTPGGALVDGSAGKGKGGAQSLSAGNRAAQAGYDFTVPVTDCILYTPFPDAMQANYPGDWRACYKHWAIIDNQLKFWARALEKWGSPMFVAKVANNDQTTITEGATLLDNITNGASAAFPSSMAYEVLSAPVGVFESYKSSIAWNAEQIAQNILGNVLTMGEGDKGATSAGADVHQDTGQTVIDHCREDLVGLCKAQIIQPLLTDNFAGFDPTLCPTLSLGGENRTDLFALMQAYEIAISTGMVWKGAKFLRESAGFPPMDEEEEAGIEQEQKAEQEAQQQIADARNSGKAGPMNPKKAAQVLELLTAAILHSE